MNSPEIDCNHDKFTDGVCDECGWECDHQDVDEGLCLICDERVIPEAPEPDDMYESHVEAERQMENER